MLKMTTTTIHAKSRTVSFTSLAAAMFPPMDNCVFAKISAVTQDLNARADPDLHDANKNGLMLLNVDFEKSFWILTDFIPTRKLRTTNGHTDKTEMNEGTYSEFIHTSTRVIKATTGTDCIIKMTRDKKSFANFFNPITAEKIIPSTTPIVRLTPTLRNEYKIVFQKIESLESAISFLKTLSGAGTRRLSFITK